MNIISILKKMFNRKQKIIYQGRAGMIFSLKEVEYFIDSELLSDIPNIVIYWDEIYLYNNKDVVLDCEVKKYIVRELLRELEKDGLVVELFPISTT